MSALTALAFLAGVHEQAAAKDRKEDTERNKAIISLLRKGVSWMTVMKSTGAARGTVAKLAKRLAEKKRAA